MKTLKQYIGKDWLKATIALGRSEQTLRTRLKSGKDWRVMTIGKHDRCVLVDSPAKG